MQIVGLDIGGSKTHAVSRHENKIAEVFAGSANLSSVGTRRPVASSTRSSRGSLSGPIAAVCAGAAGVDTPEAEEAAAADRSPPPRRRGSGRP